MTVILDDGETLDSLPPDAATAARVVRIDGDVFLSDYPHPLPALTTIGGLAYLDRYKHALPALTSIGWRAYLEGYDHALPALTSIGSSADLNSYGHALPALTTIGGWANLHGYGHPLPALTQIGGSAYLLGYEHPLPALTEIKGAVHMRGYAHLPAWIGYVGDDARGYCFWADLKRSRVRAGCRNFTPGEALAHWGRGGESDRPDCLALAQRVIIALIEGRS